MSSSLFVSVYRVSLVKDETVSFTPDSLNNSQQASRLIRDLIFTHGQPDREQFVVAFLNAKNIITGLNIVSVGSLTSAVVSPREVLKPAILSNSAAIILAHNHPSNNLEPSKEDIFITEQIIRAAYAVGIAVHEHLIISMEHQEYFSFADQGIIQSLSAEVRLNPIPSSIQSAKQTPAQ